MQKSMNETIGGGHRILSAEAIDLYVMILSIFALVSSGIDE